MESRFGGGRLHLSELGSSDLGVLGKTPLEWNISDWKWDGDLFLARRMNLGVSDSASHQFIPKSGIPEPRGSSNSSSSYSDEVNHEIEKGRRQPEKKRRLVVVEDDSSTDEGGSLSLKLAPRRYPISDGDVVNWDRTGANKTKFLTGTPNRTLCQVEDCRADLTRAKDYHRRHKVCEIHSKASGALVGNVMQRFCQQCSRFHALQEFDEGKRSCRRRLAGHNKRRRKANQDDVPNGSSRNNNQSNSYLLLKFLNMLSNAHSNRSDPASVEDLSHLLRSLGSQNGVQGDKNALTHLREPEHLLKNVTTGKSNMASTLSSRTSDLPEMLLQQQQNVSIYSLHHNALHKNGAGDAEILPVVKSNVRKSPSACSEVRDSNAGQTKMINFDLNDIYVDSDDGEAVGISPVPVTIGTSYVEYSRHSSPPQMSGNSDSVSAQSPASSSGETQSRTDRIVFKLFGKEPNDFPLVLRAQILDWLSHSPTDIESYIRPGCILLTIYLRQAESMWEEICHDLSSSLNRLLDVSEDVFWRTGLTYLLVKNQIAIILDGRVVINTSLPFCDNRSRISYVQPIAVPSSERANFSVKGVNLIHPSVKLLCAFEGRYLLHEGTYDSADGTASSKDLDEVQCINFSCSVPVISGRGFIEIEDGGLSSSFFPFIVAEEDVCAEIRVLETLLECNDTNNDFGGTGKMEAKNQALNFIYEMGWLLHRSQLKSRLTKAELPSDFFPLKRFVWLVEFSLDHGWCAVVKKLLHIMLEGTVGIGDHSSLYVALSEMGLVHRAVSTNSRLLVDMLLKFVPENISDTLGTEDKALLDDRKSKHLFRPDVVGPAGLIPLHIAAGKDGSEDVLDALTDDPDLVGIQAWKSARDSAGCTPDDYARLRGHDSYIHLVQKKIKERQGAAHTVVDIPNASPESSSGHKEIELAKSFEIARNQVRYSRGQCKLCVRSLAHRTGGKSLVYKPAMLSLLAVAAVCVCVALLLKSAPHVAWSFEPFRWEYLDFGTS